MVLADGSQVTASADESPDLFWAIRGGGGNFGVVTEFTFRAHPLETIVGGPTFWAIEDADELLAAYREWLPVGAAQRDRLLQLPHDPAGEGGVPRGAPPAEGLRRRLVHRRVGRGGRGRPWRRCSSVAEPLLHGVGRMPIAALNAAFDGLYGPGDQWYWRGAFLREIPDEAIAVNREWNERMPGFKAGTHFYPVDGAVNDVAPEDTAFGYRDATWSQVFIGCDPDPAKASAVRDWTIGYHQAIVPFSAGASYVNFMMDDEGQARVKATYGENYQRLAQVKAAVDPDNVFRVNQNILPASLDPSPSDWAARAGPDRGPALLYGSPGAARRASAAAAVRSATAAAPTKSAVTSVGRSSRPSWEPSRR